MLISSTLTGWQPGWGVESVWSEAQWPPPPAVEQCLTDLAALTSKLW